MTFTHKIKFAVIFAIASIMFIIVYIINSNTPIWSDDWAVYVSFQDHIIHTFREVLNSIKYYYLNVNGRSVTNFTLMLFVYLGKNVFDVTNSLMFVLMGIAIYFFARKGKEVNPFLFASIFLLLWFGLPVPNETLFWQTGSIVHLWVGVLLLLLLIPLKNLYFSQNHPEKYNLPKIILMFLFGLLAGNSHELMAAFIILTLFLMFALSKITRKKLPFWFYSCLSGSVLGLAIQLFAPGNYLKLNYTGKGLTLLGKFEQIKSYVFTYQSALWIIVIIICSLYLINKYVVKSKRELIDSFMFFLLTSSLLLVVAGLAFPYFPPRTLFFSSILLIVFIARFLSLEGLKIIKYAPVIIAVPFFVLSAKTTIIQSKALSGDYEKRDQYILNEVNKGERDIKVERINGFLDPALMPDPLNMPPDKNFWASRYYGVDSIETINQ